MTRSAGYLQKILTISSLQHYRLFVVCLFYVISDKPLLIARFIVSLLSFKNATQKTRSAGSNASTVWRFISFHHDVLIRIFYALDVAKTIINNQKRSIYR